MIVFKLLDHQILELLVVKALSYHYNYYIYLLLSNGCNIIIIKLLFKLIQLLLYYTNPYFIYIYY